MSVQGFYNRPTNGLANYGGRLAKFVKTAPLIPCSWYISIFIWTSKLKILRKRTYGKI